MLTLRINIFIFIVLISVQGFSQEQGITSSPIRFQTPDTVCVGQPFNIINVIGASTFYWNFCTGNANYSPSGTNIGDPGNNLGDPRFVILVRDSLECYSFVTDPGNQALVRYYLGNSFRNLPVSTARTSNILFSNEMRGVQVLKDQGIWYGFVTDGSRLIRLTFGNSLLNVPNNIIDFPIPGVTAAMGLLILKPGPEWIGFTIDFQNNELIRITFGSDLSLDPVFENLGNIGVLNGPVSMAYTKENNEWYMLVCNQTDNSLTRLFFRGSFLNTPTGENLGNVGGLEQNTGITLIRDCEFLNGYVINHQTDQNNLVHLQFPYGITGPVYGIPLPNVGNLDQSYGISEMLRAGDTIYSYVTNEGTYSLTRLFFPVCNNSSIPSYYGAGPPPISYSAPGNYNIILTVDEGSATQKTLCNNIVVLPPIVVNLGPDKTICTGTTVTLDPGKFDFYLWSNGSTNRILTTDTTGKYWVNVSNHLSCETSDTIIVTFVDSFTKLVNASICPGQSYFAQGQWQTISGSYYDSLKSITGCDSIIHTVLTVKAPFSVNLGNDTSLCNNDRIILDATTPGANSYLWQDGSADSVYLVTKASTYWVHVNVNGCSNGDTIRVGDCPSKLWFPNAFTPDGDGVNDYFQPVGISINKFQLLIYDRSGQLIFKSDDIRVGWDGRMNNQSCPSGVYTYIVNYATLDEPGTNKQKTGNFTLVR